MREGSASKVRAPSAAAGIPVIEYTAHARQSISRHQTAIFATFPITAAMAMIGTACLGPNASTSTGTSMIDAPVPMIPLIVPAASPTASTSK